MGKVIAITSGKGGTGKTTSCAALASCLAVLGYKTLCLDCDIGLKNLDVPLGLVDCASTNFTDVLGGILSLDEAVSPHPEIGRLFFLSAPAMAEPETIDQNQMDALFGEIRGRFDYCIVDSPAGLGAGFKLACTHADMAIVVETGDMTSLRDGQRTVCQLQSLGLCDIRLLVNRVRPRLFRRSKTSVDDAIDMVGARLIGLVAEDEDVILSANRGLPLICYKPDGATAQYFRIAKRIVGQKVPLGKL